MEQHQQESFGSQTGATSAIETLQRGASELTEEAKRASSEIIADKVFGLFDDVEGAVRTAARELDNAHHSTLARYINRAADEMANARSRFRSADVNDMLTAAENLARTRPVAVLGAAFAMGFALVRFLKSQNPQQSQSRGFDDGDEAAFDAESSSRGYAGRSSGRYTRESYERQSYAGSYGGGGRSGEFRGECGSESGGRRTYGSQQRDYGDRDYGDQERQSLGGTEQGGSQQGYAGQSGFQREQGYSGQQESPQQEDDEHRRKDDPAEGRSQ